MLDAPSLPSVETAARLRHLFRQTGFLTPELCSRLRCQTLTTLSRRRNGRKFGIELNDALDVLVRLFLDEERVDTAICRSLLPDELFALLKDCNLLVETAEGVLAVVFLYPCFDLWIASDHSLGPDDSPFQLRSDTVYPALNIGAQRLAQLLPEKTCERFLEVCGGTGSVALYAAKFVKERAYSSDILERCTHFARFNAALNGIENFEAVTGDLYSATPGMHFDMIVAHPPYVPQKEVQLVFRDGGEDGEAIMRRLLEELPQSLAPGGKYYMITYGSDRKDARFQDRIRGWLGEHSGEFDVLLVAEMNAPPEAMITSSDSPDRFEERVELLKTAGVVQLFYGLVVLQRRADAYRAVFTVRRDNLSDLSAEGLDHFLMLMAATATDGFASTVLSARPALAEGLELEFRQPVKNGRPGQPTVFLNISFPMHLKMQVPMWVSQFLGEVNGESTTSELYDRLHTEGIIPSELKALQFREALLPLFGAGCLTLPGVIPLPAAE